MDKLQMSFRHKKINLYGRPYQTGLIATDAREVEGEPQEKIRFTVGIDHFEIKIEDLSLSHDFAERHIKRHIEAIYLKKAKRGLFR